jgi:hypothetical protein
VKLGGKFVPLGFDRKQDKAKAAAKCRELVAEYRRQRETGSPEGVTVCEILDLFYQAGMNGIGMKQVAPRQIASRATRYCRSVNMRVTLIVTPAAASVSNASSPAAEAGTLIMRFL